MPCKFSQHVKCVATIVANWEWETKSEVRKFLTPKVPLTPTLSEGARSSLLF